MALSLWTGGSLFQEWWLSKTGLVALESQEYSVEEWIKTIDTSEVIPKRHKMVDDNDSLYFSFNYTNTLESVYHIENVMHIHGSVGDISQIKPILGHCNKSDIKKYEEKSIKEREEFLEGVSSIDNAISNYLKSTYKNTEDIIIYRNDYFKELSKVNYIEIIGWSLGDVDIPYLKKIKESVKEDTEWVIYWHDEKSTQQIYDSLRKVGIKESNVKLVQDIKFWD